MSKTPLHLVVRYSDRLSGNTKTIAEHLAVLNEYGMVWFGKMGSVVGRATRETLVRQSLAGIPSYLFLIQGLEEIHQCRIVDITLEQQNDQYVPSYYSEEMKRNMSVWIKLSIMCPVKPTVFRDFHTTSSKKTVVSTIKGSMASAFRISEGPAIIQW